MNWFCQIISATATQIQCKTPPFSPDYTNYTQKVYMTGRIIEEATCEGTCAFTYLNTGNPTVTTPGLLSYSSGNSVTLTGLDLVNAGVNPKVYVGDTLATVTDSSNADVIFTFPALRQGTYRVSVYV